MNSGRRIVLGEDDFADEAPTSPTTVPLTATASAGLPPVAHRPPVQIRNDHIAPQGGAAAALGAGNHRRWLTDARTAPLLAAVAGIVVGWASSDLLGISDLESHSKSGLNAVSGLWTGCIGLLFCGVVLGFDRAVQGAWQEAWRRAVRGALPAFAIAFVSGYIAQAVYTHMIESALRHSIDISPHDARFYLARVIGWGIFGLGIGATLGLIERSRPKAINGAIGGVIGGAAGGAIFQYTAVAVHSEHLSRLLGLLGVGLLIAVGTRTVEAARRDAWLQVIAGGMAGKEFILYHAVTRLGSSPDCEIFLLKDPAVASLHAQIEDRGNQRVLTALDGSTVYVNQAPVSSQLLRDGDQIQVGNTVIGYAERATALIPGSVAAPGAQY